MTRYKAILFDFDGTLVDTAPGIVATMRETFKRMGVAIPDEAAMRSTIGIPLGKALAQLASLDAADEAEAVNIYGQLFQEYELGALSVYPHVTETLDRLMGQGIRMAIVTSRDTSSLELITKPHHLDHYFETVITGSAGLPPKPAPDLVNALLQRMQLNPSETLVVGDTTFDIGMGNSAGCDTCAVTYGNHPLAKLKSVSPTHIIDDFSALLNIV